MLAFLRPCRIPKCLMTFGRRLCVCTALLLALAASQSASAQEKFYYWVTPYPSDRQANRYESFVIELDAPKKAEFDAVFANGPVMFEGEITAGSVPYNKNYHSVSQPVWNWHFASITRFYNYDPSAGCFIGDPAPCESHPSEIAADPAKWIAEHGRRYFPTKYVILGPALDPTKKDAVANVSNRGMTGDGERTVITGFIITGGEPRTVVVRALGPSMSGSGVQQPAADPQITVYRGSGQSPFASNADWKLDSRSAALQRDYPSLAPTNDKEAALMLTLWPGRYTLHGTNTAGTEGVLLLEVYDVDSAGQ